MHLFEHCLVAHVMCGNYWIEYSAFSHPHTQTHILPTSNIEMNFPRHFRVISIFVEMGIFAWKQLKSFRLLVILIPKRNAWPFKVANNHYANFWRTIPHTEMWICEFNSFAIAIGKFPYILNNTIRRSRHACTRGANDVYVMDEYVWRMVILLCVIIAFGDIVIFISLFPPYFFGGSRSIRRHHTY